MAISTGFPCLPAALVAPAFRANRRRQSRRSSADPIQVAAKIVSLIDTVRYRDWPQRLVLIYITSTPVLCEGGFQADGYDNNGNATSKTDSTGTTNYTWDFENRLNSVTLPASGGTVSFKYDPFGRRIYKSSSSGTSIYAYDGFNLTEEVNSTGIVAARYTQTQNVDEPLAMLRSSTTSYYHADGLGSVTSLSNTAGTLAQTYTFDSFGKQTASTGSLVNPFQYTGRESDPETGLYYYRARYYDPAVGRFARDTSERQQVWRA